MPLAFGSDSPVTPLDPWAAVRAARYPAHPDAAISVEVAFAAHTRGGWRAAGRDAEGDLAPGAAATFAVWHGADAPAGLPDVSPGRDLPGCARTVVRGVTIFDAGLASG